MLLGNFKTGSYELLVPVWPCEVEFQPTQAKHIKVHLGEGPIDEDIEAELAPAMFEAYPIMISEGAYLMRDDVFERISHYIDWDYFLKTEVEI